MCIHSWSYLVTAGRNWQHLIIVGHKYFINHMVDTLDVRLVYRFAGHSWSHVVTLGHIFEIQGLWRPYGPIFRSNSASTISLELVGTR